jgi:Glycosyltransferase family 87
MNKSVQLEDKIFTEPRLRLYGYGGIVVFVFVILSKVLVRDESWPVLRNGNPACLDFGFFWLSGKLAIAGDTPRIFNFPAWEAVQAAFFDPGSCINFNRFYYPPTLLFLTYPLGLMPYLIALVVWIVVSFGLYLATVFAIIRTRVAVIVAAAPTFAMLSNVYLGHTGFLTAALIGLSLVFIERRPVFSGISLALLTYKPHLGVLFPIALVVSRNWRVLGSATLVTVVVGVLAALAFGYDGWTSFIDALTDRNSGLGPAPGVEMRLQSIFGLFQLAGASTLVSWSAQLVVSIIVTLGICMLWAKPISHNLRAAALCGGLLLVSPYVLLYDLTILSIAAAFFVKEGLSRGFLIGERMAILICWVLLLFVSWRVGPVICAVLLFLIIRRLYTGSVVGVRRPTLTEPTISVYSK